MQESSVYQHLVETAAEERYQQGIAQGKLEGKREVVLRLLHTQFQNVPASLLERIMALESISALDTLFDQAMTAKSLDDLQV